jgi:tripartite-type tricarboxylate transporter receptor subunit TctC
MKRTFKVSEFFLIAMCMAVAVMSAPAIAQTDFYANKTIHLVPAFPPGASVDRTTRIIAQFLPKYLPGKPTIVVENMDGAGGIKDANYIFNKAARDGTVIGVFNAALPTQEMIGQPGVAYKASQYNWVGALTSVRMVCYVTEDTDIHSMDDLMKPRSQPILFGGAGVGNVQTTLANFLHLAGGQVKVIAGYPSSNEIYLALQQGELQGSCSPWEGVKIDAASQLQSGHLRVFVQDGTTKDPELPNAQLMEDAVRDPDHRALWDALTRPQAAARPMALPPEVPAERVTMVRRAYDAVMQDPDFRAALAKTGDAVNPVKGEDLQALVTEIMASSPEVVKDLKGLYGAQ